MSDFPYGQFNEGIYSSHAAPAQQQQQQHQHQQEQEHQRHQIQQQHQQQHQESRQEIPSAFPSWQTLEQLDQQQQQSDMEMAMQSPLDIDTTPVPTPSSTSFQLRTLDIDIVEPPLMVPSQSSPVNDAPVLLHHPHAMEHQDYSHNPYLQQRIMSRPGSSMGPLLFTDTSAPPPTPGPGMGANLPGGHTGVVRSTGTRGGRASGSHPYIKPSPATFLSGTMSAAGSPSPGSHAGGTPTTKPIPLRGSSVQPPTRARKPSAGVRFQDPTAPTATGLTRPKTSRAQSASILSPVVGTSTRLPFIPAASSPQQTTRSSFGAQGTAAHSPPNQSPLSRFPSSQPQDSPSVLQDRSPLSQPPILSFPTLPMENTATTHYRLTHTKQPMRHIPTDMCYSSETHTLSASLEVPGVRRENVHVTMGTCYFNHIKFICVVAESEPVFKDMVSSPGPSAKAEGKLRSQAMREEEEEEEESVDSKEGAMNMGGSSTAHPQSTPATKQESTRTTTTSATTQRPPASFRIPKLPPSATTNIGRLMNPSLRERRFGISRRVIQVPSSTTMQDVDASLEDGVLTLRIYCGEPFEIDDELEIPVR